MRLVTPSPASCLLTHALIPKPLHLREDPEAIVCSVALGLTVTLAEPVDFLLRQGPAQLLRAFLALAPDTEPHAPRWFWTSARSGWRRLSSDVTSDLSAELSAGAWLAGRPRHLFSFRVTDRPSAPRSSLHYWEVDPARSARPAGFSITLPAHLDARRLEDVLAMVASEHPIFAALTGFEVSLHPELQGVGLRAAYPWFRRYLGLQPPAALTMRRMAPVALPGVAWLTAVGLPLQARLPGLAAAASARAWGRGVGVSALPRALILRAGAAPELGDLNQMEYPSALAEVAQVMSPFLPNEPVSLPGGFHVERTTADWMRRFEAPERWS